MKSFFLSIIAILIFLLVLSITVLSTAGFETNKFNKVISSKITDTNKNIDLKLIKIKFKIDIKNFNLFLETQNPKFTYKDLEIPIKDLKVYFDFTSLILSKPKIDKINLSSGKININQLKKIVVKLKPSNINSLIVNKVQTGKLKIYL